MRQIENKNRVFLETFLIYRYQKAKSGEKNKLLNIIVLKLDINMV